MGDGVGAAPIAASSSQSTSRPESPDLADQILGMLAPTPPPASPVQGDSHNTNKLKNEYHSIGADADEGAANTDHPNEPSSTSPEDDDDDDSFLRDVELVTNGTSEVCFRLCFSESILCVACRNDKTFRACVVRVCWLASIHEFDAIVH